MDFFSKLFSALKYFVNICVLCSLWNCKKNNPYLVITSNWNGHVNSSVKSCGNPAHDFVPKDKGSFDLEL